ncbi:MAG: iron chelate uptake ABC transporter family permease subunit, partial [Oscillospiraceae bacterium]|nr:iron chelate uptake ABC transporter family permease subunit [Oscillospiraceae bacterium]
MKVKRKRIAPLLIFLILAAVLSIILAIGIGPVAVSPITTAKVLVSKIPFFGSFLPVSWDALSENIVLMLRLPRVLLGVIVGASLAVCGV